MHSTKLTLSTCLLADPVFRGRGHRISVGASCACMPLIYLSFFFFPLFVLFGDVVLRDDRPGVDNTLDSSNSSATATNTTTTLRSASIEVHKGAVSGIAVFLDDPRIVATWSDASGVSERASTVPVFGGEGGRGRESRSCDGRSSFANCSSTGV